MFAAGMPSPKWGRKQGTKRILKEFEHMQQQITQGHAGPIYDLQLVKDNICCWRFKVGAFHESVIVLADGRNCFQREFAVKHTQ